MQNEFPRLVAEIKHLAGSVHSFISHYHSVSRLQLMPMEASGKAYFLAPDNCRAEATINNSLIVTVRKGSEIKRIITKRKEIWRYSFKDLPQELPINAGIADLTNPFVAVDESTLSYKGQSEVEGSPVHRFIGQPRNWMTQGLLDTRKGFSISYQPKNLEIEFEILIDIAKGLLLQIVGTDRSGTRLLDAYYTIDAINIPIDSSLFLPDDSTATFRQVDMTEILISSLNPDIADTPPSIN